MKVKCGVWKVAVKNHQCLPCSYRKRFGARRADTLVVCARAIKHGSMIGDIGDDTVQE